MTENTENIFIKYRLELADAVIEEVEILINNKLTRVAINRIYYGMFYSLLALAVKHNFKTSKHAQIIGWFNKNFVHTGIFPLKYGKIIQDAFEQRNEADYGQFNEFNIEEVRERYAEMIDFIATIKRNIIE